MSCPTNHDFHLSGWEYNAESDLVSPLDGFISWVEILLGSSKLEWYQCLLLVGSNSGLRSEALAPARHADRSKWLRRALTGSHALLLILTQTPEELLHAFNRADITDLSGLPWSIPNIAIQDLLEYVAQSGGGTIIGHDGQFVMTIW